MIDKGKWIPIGDAAKYLGVSRDTLRRWEKAGRIKAHRSPTNRRYYTKEQLDQVIGKPPKKKKVVKPGTGKSEVFKLAGFGLIGLIIAVLIALAAIFLVP
ncbi:hypothetical protein AMJ51_00510 [Microgenomates bacterium DG_75]|nr:MAG: hypothetical protein AMJ51_00510 [Microgenomates bacterium DG_75]